MTIESKNKEIEGLKETIVQGEIKSRKLLEQLNKEVSKNAQKNIDGQIDCLRKNFADPSRLNR